MFREKEIPYEGLSLVFTEQAGFPIQAETQPTDLSLEKQLELLRGAQLPIDLSTVNHIYGHYDRSNHKPGLLDLRTDAQGELFQRLTLSLFEIEVSEVSSREEDINPTELLRSMMTSDEGTFDPRFDEPMHPSTVLRSFEGFVEKDLLTEEEAEECVSVWIEPYSPEFHDQVAEEIRRKKQKEAERVQWYQDLKQYIDNPEVDLADVPEHLRESFLRATLANIVVQDPEKAKKMFYSLEGREPMQYIETMVDGLVGTSREEEVFDILRHTRAETMKISVREHRLARNKAARAKYGKKAKQERKPKLEIDEEEVFSLLHPHVLVGDLEGMTAVFEHIDGDNFHKLCEDLGVTTDQFNSLLIWTYSEERPESKIGDKDSYELGHLLRRSYADSEFFHGARSLYGEILERRLRALGMEGVGLIPEKLMEDGRFVRGIAANLLRQGDAESSVPWLQKYHQLTEGESYPFVTSVTNLFQDAARETK